MKLSSKPRHFSFKRRRNSAQRQALAIGFSETTVRQRDNGAEQALRMAFNPFKFIGSILGLGASRRAS